MKYRVLLNCVCLCLVACQEPSPYPSSTMQPGDSIRIATEVEAAVWAFHEADTSKNAEAVIDLLWPEYTMFVDGNRVGYDDVSSGSRAFMADLATFHTEWTDLKVVPLGPNNAIASFIFSDSIVTKNGDLTQSRGPNTFVWQKRNGEWKIIYGDADHYPL